MSRRMWKSCLGAAILVTLLSAAPVGASVIVGGITFDDDAFADTLISSSGSYTVGGNTTDLTTAVVGYDVDNYAYSFSSGAYLELGFTDNVIVNDTGDDVALFELGLPDTFKFSLTIGGVTKEYLTVGTGYTGAGFALNVARINLDDFGVAAGASISSIVIGMDVLASGGTVPSFTAAGALNSRSNGVPEPSTIVTGGLAAVMGLGYGWRRKRRSAA